MAERKFTPDKFYKQIEKELSIKNKEDFILEFKALSLTLVKEYEKNIKATNDFNYKANYLEQRLRLIDELNIKRKQYDDLILEDLRDSSLLLDDTYNYFYKELTDLYTSNYKSESASKKSGKPGRKKVEIKEASEYLQNFVNDHHKEKFLRELKKQYQKSPHLIFNYVIKVLSDKYYLKPSTLIELKEAFEIALGRKKQTPQNFNTQFNKNLKSTREYKAIENNIINIFESCLID